VGSVLPAWCRVPTKAGAFLAMAAMLLLVSGGSAGQTASPNGAIPTLVNYNGILIDESGNALSGPQGVTFLLYEEQEGGSPLWMEIQTVVGDKSGRYSAVLGSSTSQGLPIYLFASGQARWLGVQTQGQAEQPRIMLLAVPYALKAGDAQTVGGLPPSAFVLAAPTGGNTASSSASSESSGGTAAPTIGGGGTAGYLAAWADNNGDLGNSILFQKGTGSSAKIGINEASPLFTLDVNGTTLSRGLLELATTNYATKTKGYNSQPFNFESSAFNSNTNKYALNHFQWQAEPAGNNTTTPGATLNLLYGTDPSSPTETGLNIASNGQITFASGQSFPGAGTITGITTSSGSGLTGGGTSGTLSLGLTQSCAANQTLQWTGAAWACANFSGGGTITGVTAGTDLTGGGTSGIVTLNVDTTKIPQLNTTNTFTGNQTVNGNLSATGTMSAASYQIGSTAFAFGTAANGNAMLGFAGNSTMSGASNTGTGAQALLSNTTGASNAAFGAYALFGNTTGSQNTGIGSAALYWNTTGTQNTATGFQALNRNTIGSSNTATGFDALFTNTSGNSNTGDGFAALFWNSTGSFNAASGYQALNANTTGSGNTAAGGETLFANTTGGGNAALGTYALYSNTTASANTGLGYASLYWNTTGTNETASGYQALNNNTTGNDNTAVGYEALFNSSTGNQNTAVGSGALYSNTNNLNGLTAVGYEAAYNAGSDSTAVGWKALLNGYGMDNTAVGYAALLNDTSGQFNTAVGSGTLFGDNLGFNNTAIGYNALAYDTAGGANTATGVDALYSVDGGNANTADGIDALGVSWASENTAMGAYSLGGDVSGAENTAVGYYSMTNNVSGNYLTCVGYNCQSDDGLVNATAIGANAVVSQSNSLVLGGIGSYAVKVGIGTTKPSNILTIARGAGHPVSDSWETYSSRRWKTNIQTLPDALSKVERLRGVTYDRKDNGKHEIGVIAEEVGAVVPEVVSYEANGKDASGVDYSRLTALLIEATKQQQRELASALRQIRQQQRQLRMQNSTIRSLQAQIREDRQSLRRAEARLSPDQPMLQAQQ
jgi:hypothetical protein